jgi:hypothetical protein
MVYHAKGGCSWIFVLLLSELRENETRITFALIEMVTVTIVSSALKYDTCELEMKMNLLSTNRWLSYTFVLRKVSQPKLCAIRAACDVL